MGLREALPWYGALEGFIRPSWPLMVAIAAVIIAVTLYLLLKGNPVLLAGWLVYLVSP